MQAIEIKQPGGPEVLVPTQRPDPVPKAGELLIAVTASGINRPDVLQRKGLYPMPPGVSDLPGLEVAGTVAAGAPEDLATAGLKIGDRVCALVAGGGYAQLCVAPAGQCLPVPKGLSDIEAAALPETFFTVWQNVFQNARLKRGETLLVQGGSSGIGVTAIHLAKAFGVTVIVTAGSDDKCAACVAQGADHAINYKTQDFVAEVKRITGGRGVDVVLDMVAGDYLAREVQCMADDGRIAIIAVQGGTQAALDVGALLRKRLAIIGSTLRPRSIAYKTVIARELREQVWPLIEAGTRQAGDPQRVPGRAGGTGACADGIERARGQDRARLESEHEHTPQAGRRQLEDARQPSGQCRAAGGHRRRAALHGRRGGVRAVPVPVRNGGHAGRQRHPLGRAGLLGAQARRLHRRGLGRRCWPSSAAATSSSATRSGVRCTARSDQLVADKAQAALGAGVTPIVCVGETLAQREAGETAAVVKRQLSVVIHTLAHCASEMVVAYEPVWAIGTGLSATPQQAQEVHALLRAQLQAATPHAAQMKILYGGSVKPDNAAALFEQAGHRRRTGRRCRAEGGRLRRHLPRGALSATRPPLHLRKPHTICRSGPRSFTPCS